LWSVSGGASARVKKIPAVADGRYTEFILLFSVETGALLAILPDGYIQKMRVALTHALAAKYLARADARVLGLFGSGWQAGAQALVQSKVRKLSNIRVYSPNVEHRTRFVERLRSMVPAGIEAVPGPEELMKSADIVVAATDSQAPVILPQWLEPGMHLTSVRAWTEIEAEALKRCDRVFVHNKTRSLDFVCGDTIPRQMISADGPGLDTGNCPDLADVVGGKVAGRTGDGEITLFVDGNQAGGPGLGIQFAAVGAVVYRHAIEAGLGQHLPLDWFLDREDHPYIEDTGRT
jgi:ornithine cyclodeaminase/alanine dehydrogenase-like protein (mu-crystallin family)